jgi:hypothetical protein
LLIFSFGLSCVLKKKNFEKEFEEIFKAIVKESDKDFNVGVFSLFFKALKEELVITKKYKTRN